MLTVRLVKHLEDPGFGTVAALYRATRLATVRTQDQACQRAR